MVRRQRHLRGAHQVEVLALDPVDVVGGLPQEAGALHRPRLHQRGRDHRGEAGPARLVHGHRDQGQLEVGTHPRQVVEARPRDLGPPVDVDGAEQAAELDVVARLEVEGGRAPPRARARRSRPRRPPGPRRPRGSGWPAGRPGRRPRPRTGRPRPASPRPTASWCGSSRACRSSPWACGICRPSVFCSPRSASNPTMAARRTSSAARARSTTSADSPRLPWAARRRSGSSRSIRGSITRSA